MERLNFKAIKTIYLAILECGFSIKIENDKLIMWHPESNDEWTLTNNEWATWIMNKPFDLSK